ncbi:hypothetical protein [Streptomyces brasiliensis]|nr:hypothetical protein [Streptomyces brasiliensis]
MPDLDGRGAELIRLGENFYYTPEALKAPGNTHVDAPGEPGKVRY